MKTILCLSFLFNMVLRIPQRFFLKIISLRTKNSGIRVFSGTKYLPVRLKCFSDVMFELHVSRHSVIFDSGSASLFIKRWVTF
jgi:hypothetical protein